MDVLWWILVIAAVALGAFWCVQAARHLDDPGGGRDLSFGAFLVILLQAGPIAVLYWLLFGKGSRTDSDESADQNG